MFVLKQVPVSNLLILDLGNLNVLKRSYFFYNDIHLIFSCFITSNDLLFKIFKICIRLLVFNIFSIFLCLVGFISKGEIMLHFDSVSPTPACLSRRFVCSYVGLRSTLEYLLIREL